MRDEASTELPAFLRVKSTTSRFAPLDQLDQFSAHLAPPEILELMPADEKRRLKNRLRELRDTQLHSQTIKKERLTDYII